MRRPAGIRRKIWVVFVLQLAAISFATVVSVFGAATILEDVLVKRTLANEAAHFFEQRHRQTLPPPNTYTLRGYFVDGSRNTDSLPASLRQLQEGYHHVRADGLDDLVHVQRGAGGTLYLLFQRGPVHRLALTFGVIPLAVVLVIIAISTWVTYRASRRALSPIVALAANVREWDPKRPELNRLEPEQLPGEVDHDVEVLSRALHRFATRIEEFVERERNFTRDASHELRSPLTVIKVAADVLADDPRLDEFARRVVARIQTAGRDMEALIETFLILAREADTGLPEEDFDVNTIAREEVERARPYVEQKPVTLTLVEHGQFALHASSRVVSVMLGNLVRNACLFTDHGSVTVTVGSDYVKVEDTGGGMSQAELAQVFRPAMITGPALRGRHGVGLTIVKRLSDRFGWPITIDSELGRGTIAIIGFPQARPTAAAA
ncbi:sensor histidine kinase [Tahibacter amnicola]|uniref:histidine kinase n=1 Tax=Tahibacter amnicola TaxID=2976241 RepID=A0ABY6BBW7_9GAMM|nr:HAMP domain-containing sensor histidine kinase [Tahibacter amnicola]UXI67549.1 HAMP domain-containing histidine kinase [Tahibacter amnicola]